MFMTGIVNYIIESGISLSLLAVIYAVFLRRETFFMLNRMFLLGSLLFSVLLPLLRIRIYEPNSVMLSEITVTPYQNLLEAVTIYGQDFSVSVEHAILSTSSVVWIYIAGLVFFLGRFLWRVIQVVFIIHRHEVISNNGIKTVLLDKETSPFSFLNYLFISRSYKNDEGLSRMVHHEMEHIRQGHSIDVLFLEVLTVFQWFNPFMWILRSSVRENHEFLADQAVLKSGVNPGFYKKLLLDQYAEGQLVITNNFNYSLIKKRFKMMSKIKSSKISNLKISLGLLIAVAMIVVFACEQKESIEPVSVQDDLISVKSTIMADGKIKLEGTVENLKKYSELFADSHNFKIVTDESGNMYLEKQEALVPKSLDAGEEIFFIVDDMPEFPGGEMELRKYMANNISYPEEALKKGIQGKVYVTFVVDAKGQVANAKIARGVDPSLDREALRVVNSLPAWIPGKQKGKPVNVSYTVPINFALQ
jgi:TonB family protein